MASLAHVWIGVGPLNPSPDLWRRDQAIAKILSALDPADRFLALEARSDLQRAASAAVHRTRAEPTWAGYFAEAPLADAAFARVLLDAGHADALDPDERLLLEVAVN